MDISTIGFLSSRLCLNKHGLTYNIPTEMSRIRHLLINNLSQDLERLLEVPGLLTNQQSNWTILNTRVQYYHFVPVMISYSLIMQLKLASQWSIGLLWFNSLSQVLLYSFLFIVHINSWCANLDNSSYLKLLNSHGYSMVLSHLKVIE